MSALPLGIPLDEFLSDAEARGLDSAALKRLLEAVGSPPEVTNLPALFDTLDRILPLASRLDPASIGAQAEALAPLLAALRQPQNRAWLDGLPSHQPRKNWASGDLGGLTSKFPVYACLVQRETGIDTGLRTVPQALLLVHLLAPRRLQLHGSPSAAANDAANCIRKAALNIPEWRRILHSLPPEGELADSPIGQLAQAFAAMLAYDPMRSSRLRLLNALVQTLPEPPPPAGLHPSAGGNDPPRRKPPPRPRPPMPPGRPPELGDKGPRLRPRPTPPPRVPSELSGLVDPEGLAPEELGSGATLYDSPAEAKAWDPGEGVLAFFSMRYATLLDHQHLIWRWTVLNRHDLDRLTEALAAGLVSTDPAVRCLALAVGLMLATGQDLPDVARLRVVADLRSLPPEVLDGRESAVAQAEGIWVHPTRAPEDGYHPPAAVLGDLEPVVPWLRLPLPLMLVDALKGLGHTPPYRLADTLVPLGEAPPAALRAWLRQLRRLQPGLRATPARVRDALHAALLAQCADPIAAAFTLGTARFPAGSGRYYTSFEAAALRGLYRRALGQALPGLGALAADPTGEDPPVGSQLRPASGTVKRLADGLGKALARALPAAGRTQDLAAAHNAMVLYTLALLWYATGVRAVTDPFESLALMLPEADLAAVADKVHQGGRDGRPVVLCATAKAQLAAYQRHLQALAGRWARHDAGLARRIAATAAGGQEALWLLFLLERQPDDGAHWIPQPITVARARDAFDAHGWRLPLNTQRHVLATALRPLGVPAEYIAGQLGHAQRGDHLLGEHSVLSPADLRPLAEGTDRLLASFGFVVRGGVKPHYSCPGADSGTTTTLDCTPGHRQRAEHREGPPHLRARLVALSKEIAPDGSWTGARVAALGAQLIALGLDPQDLGRLEGLAGRWLARHAPGALAASGWLPGYLLLPEPSPIDLNQLPLARRALDLEARLGAAIDREPKAAAIEALARLWVAAALDGLCSAKRLRQLATALDAGALYGWQDRLWMECGTEPFPRRWHPGFLPAMLLVDWRTRNLVVPDLADAEDHLLKLWLPKTAPGRALEELAAAAGALARVRLPGYLAAYAREDSRSVSLPLGAWLRLLTGRPLASGAIPLPDASPPADNGQPLRSPIDSACTRTLWRTLRETLQAHAAGSLDRKSAIECLAILTDPLAAPVARALAAWARELLARSRSRLAASTVREYLLTVGGFLIAVAQDIHSFFRLDPDEYEDLYGRVLDLGRPGHRDYRARRLAAFHQFLVEHYRTVGLATSVFDISGPGPGVDANLLTPMEYERARGLIAADEGASHEQRRIAALSLAILFRLGLRVGEWGRLRACDLVLPESGVVLIRSRAGAKTKTLQGQRQIPVVLRMPREEWDAVVEWSHQRRQADGARARLFDPAALDLKQYLTWIVRRASGEPELNLRHLRHASATLTALWADPPRHGTPEEWCGPEPQAVRAAWFGEIDALPTRRTLWQIATQHGMALT